MRVYRNCGLIVFKRGVKNMCTHEQYIHAVRELAIQYAQAFTDASKVGEEDLIKLQAVKLTYGRGTLGLRGVTQFNAWKHTHDTDLIEICALGEESWVQLAGTTIHELGHALAGIGAGHSKQWKDACNALGLRRIKAAGTEYKLANFHPWLRFRLALMNKPSDGNPTLTLGNLFKYTKGASVRVCTQGVGTKGGKSRGVGSGSRLRKYVCGHGQIIRASTDTLDCMCNNCNTAFQLA
jgi:hypothetical protein